MIEDYHVYSIKLPPGVEELILPEPEGGYTVYLSDRLDCVRRLQLFRHAVRHAQRGDFDSDKRDADVNKIENETHKEDEP